MLKNSRQREAIKDYLMSCHTHPTAEAVYLEVKEKFPNISLGTIYRNLSLLSELGEIQRLCTGIGPDRFDGNPKPHYHFICRKCENILDLNMIDLHHINVLAAQDFSGKIEGHTAYFYGVCPDCQHTDNPK